jgi:hypothetical protein
MSKQTAVEWLEEKLKENLKHIVLNGDYVLMESIFLQAKAMEKEQMGVILPSDEEIEEASPYVPKDAHDYYFGDKQGFIDGAKWMRDKIKGGEQ